MKLQFRFAWIIVLFCVGHAGAEVIEADPSNYKTQLDKLKAGDVLELAAGDYADGLTINGLHGSADSWFVIRGPASGARARFLGDPRQSRNTIQFRSGSYVAIENLHIDGQNIADVFGIDASGSNVHHIRIEGCLIEGHGATQSTIGISTKVTTWNWIIRRNRIVGAGTGMYLGNSTGGLPFIAGLIEYNLFEDSRGYNVQIKHQNPRNDVAGMPTTPQKTIIRHNVFFKDSLTADSGARPNLLLGTFPDTGNGSEDMYEVYGNVFYKNHTEALLQVTGRVTIHDNLFLDCGSGSAIRVTDHNGPIKLAYIYNNTFYSGARAITFGSTPRNDYLVTGNLMLMDAGVVGSFDSAKVKDNIQDSASKAGQYINSTSLAWGTLDLHPLAGKAKGAPLDLSKFVADTDTLVDFNGKAKGAREFRGAYAGEGANPGWQVVQGIKPQIGAGGGDSTAPTGTVAVNGGAAKTTSVTVTLALAANDADSGMGAGASMQFSNDGKAWSPAEAYAASRAGWDLSKFGGTPEAGSKTVYARFKDVAGNWSAPVSASIEFEPDGDPGTRIDPEPSGGGCSTSPGGSPDALLIALFLSTPFILLRRRSSGRKS